MAERVGVWALTERLGEGAFSTVWLGVRPDGSRAAVRLFRSEPSARVQRAAVAVVAGIRHPNIPELIEFGDAEGGRLYTATRYVAGESLRQRLERGPRCRQRRCSRLAAHSPARSPRCTRAGSFTATSSRRTS